MKLMLLSRQPTHARYWPATLQTNTPDHDVFTIEGATLPAYTISDPASSIAAWGSFLQNTGKPN